ncbi:MAG: cytochrome c oxidase assembly protein [Bacteriovoracia bacterium]
MKNPFLAVGVLCLILAWIGPVPSLAEKTFYGHMIMHMLVVAIASPFIALGIIRSPFDPALKYPSLFAPVPAAMGELVIVWAWHAPSLHHFARHSNSGFMLEQGLFLFAGVWVWLSSLSGSTSGDRERMGAGIIGLLITSMHMTLLGALLNLSGRALFHHGGHGTLTAIEDQQMGGAIMLVVGGIAYLTGGLWLALCLIKVNKSTADLETL